MSVTRSLIVAALLAIAASALAEDIVVNLPEGYRASRQPVQYRAGTLAVLVGTGSGESPTHVFTWRDGVSSLTPVRQRPAGLGISADGQLVVVGSLNPPASGMHPDDGVDTILNTRGQIVATSTNRFGRSFGLSSSRLLEWNMEAQAGSVELAVFDIDGNLLGRARPQQRPVGAVMLGEPATIAYATSGSVAVVDATRPDAAIWQVQLSATEPPIQGLQPLGHDQLLVVQRGGLFKILSTSGRWLYDVEPSEHVCGGKDCPFRPAQTSSPDWLLLTTDAKGGTLLHLPSQEMLSAQFDDSKPEGFTLEPRVLDYSHVFIGPTAIIIRPLPPGPLTVQP